MKQPLLKDQVNLIMRYYDKFQFINNLCFVSKLDQLSIANLRKQGKKVHCAYFPCIACLL